MLIKNKERRSNPFAKKKTKKTKHKVILWCQVDSKQRLTVH